MPQLIPATGADVIPPQDADAALWFEQFALTWVPANYNVILPTAATLTALAADFTTRLAASSDPGTRSTVSIVLKNSSRNNASTAFREAVRAAQAAFLAGLVTETSLNLIGVRANSLIRTPINAPVFPPILSVDGSLTGQTRFRLTQVDPLTGVAVTTRGFSSGIVGIEIQRKVGVGPFLLRQTIRRIRFFDDTSDEVMGTVLLYRSRYITARGLVSPWSASVQAVAF